MRKSLRRGRGLKRLSALGAGWILYLERQKRNFLRSWSQTPFGLGGGVDRLVACMACIAALACLKRLSAWGAGWIKAIKF